MGFFGTLAGIIRDFLESLFASSSPEIAKSRQLRQLSAELKKIDPPIYRADGFLLPAFPAALYQIFQKTMPIREILSATVMNQDKRVSERYRDYLIELAFTEEQRKARSAINFAERGAALVVNAKVPERLIEEQGKQFTAFLRQLDAPNVRQINVLLDTLFALGDFCAFDFNDFFAYFDPAFKAYKGQESTVASPSFRQASVTELVPAMLDLYYVLAGVQIIEAVIDVVAILDAKRNNAPLGDDTKGKVSKYLQFLGKLITDKMSASLLLSIIRVTKEDPSFKPERASMKTDFIAQYKARLTDVFGGDSAKLLKDSEEGELRGLISATFGDITLDTVEGYCEATNALIQEFTPFNLQWVRPLEIIKTFAVRYFEPHFKQILRSVVVEGYFANRTFQSSISASYYFCEAVSAKLSEFEALFGDNQICSVKILTGYLTEMEKGMDFEKPLRQMIENMNGHAKSFVQQSVNAYADVYNFCVVILDDNKKTVPESITNIRTLTGSVKNAESFANVEKELSVFRNFLEIMKKYAIVGTLSETVTMAERTES